MKASSQFKLEQRIAEQEHEAILELQTIVKDIERCEKTVDSLRKDLDAVNAKHANRKTTQEDINYLEDLLGCAKRKLVWEKQMASLTKRTPALMEKIERVVNHPLSQPNPERRAALLESLNAVKAAMDRLQQGAASNIG